MDGESTKKRILNLVILAVILVLIIVLAVTSRRNRVSDTSVAVPTQEEANQMAQSGWLTFQHKNPDYTIMYPEGFTVNPAYAYTALGPDRDIPGVAFVVAPAITAGTNLSSDTSLSIEFPPKAAACEPRSYLSSAMSDDTVVENGISWHVVRGADTAVGNHYDETLYVRGDCSVIVRYFVHSTNVMNYDPGTVKEFDRGTLIGTFDRMRATLMLAQ